MVMNTPNYSRRRFLKRLGLLGAAGGLAGGGYAKWVEPHWLNIQKVSMVTGTPVQRLAFFTDLHYKGDRAYVEAVVAAINREAPDFVCFGGDLIEDRKFVPEALELLSGIKAPLYGVPGNHDYWSRADFGPYRKAFAATGGGWLMNEYCDLAEGRLRLNGLACRRDLAVPLPLKPGAKNIVLMHFPAWAKRLGSQQSDLLLAGHSHGGQVRIPGVGSLVVPFNVDEYDMGMFQTPAGPLYVNPGIGWLHLKVRFNCRPEVTIFEV